MNLSIFQPIRDWFSLWIENYTSSGSESDQTQSLSEHTPVELPTALQLELSQAIQNLSPHPTFYQSIEVQLKSSLQAFNQHSEAPNSLVILGNPSDVLPLTVHHHLENWLRNGSNLHQPIKQQESEQESEQESGSDRPFGRTTLISLCANWNHRPSNFRDIVSQLKSELQNLEADPPADPQRSQSSSSTLPIVFLPLLEWCFLRCVDGFEGIDLLIDYVLSDRSRFWVIGCNSWAWTYLDHVCQISTYFEQTMMLPDLRRYELKEWLSPIAEKVNLVVEDGADDKTKQLQLHLDENRDEPDNWISNREKRFYEKLASDSRGLSNVAADLWLRSLSVAEEDDQIDESEQSDSVSRDQSGKNLSSNSRNESSETPPSEDQPSEKEASPGLSDTSFSPAESSDYALSEHRWPRLRQNNVSSPRLFPLDVGDRHILYSILLHGHISVSHLARSLGDDESIVRANVQLLLRAGILNRYHDYIQVDSAYYLSIRSDLERNNFLVGDISS